MSRSGSRILDQYLKGAELFLKGVELLLQQESRLASFGAKVAPSLNVVDPSFVNSVAGSYM
jgi:hypothetical protein